VERGISPGSRGPDRQARVSVERIGNLDRVLKHLVQRKRAGDEAVCERLTVEVLHDQIVEAVVAAVVVHGANVGMTERRHGAGFTSESLASTGTRHQVWW
jgi:hypothetical protein